MKTLLLFCILISSFQTLAANAKVKKTTQVRTSTNIAKTELNILCTLAKAQLKKNGLTQKGFNDLLASPQPHNFTSVPVIEGWSAFKNASPEKRYPFLKAAAKKVGVKFHCPALYKWSDFKS
jgi:hypothetical protein